MIITISEKWRVRRDSFNHTLENFSEGGELITFGKGAGTISKPSWNVFGYYPNMLQCLRAVVREDALAMDNTDLNGYITRLEQLHEEIKG